jgi:hypothetical protein
VTVQTFFPELGVDQQLKTQLAVIEEQIESCNRLRRHALKIKNFAVVTECDKDLFDLGETARAMRSLLAMRQHGTPCPGQGLDVPDTEAKNGQRRSTAAETSIRLEPETTLKSNFSRPGN